MLLKKKKRLQNIMSGPRMCVYVSTCFCVYVDYARAYIPKHTCRCKSMGKLII